jgi:hypothetical protein
MKANNLNRFSRRAVPPATREQIAALAHEIWRERGCPAGSDVDIWLEAERQLNGGAPPRNLEVDPIPADPGNPDVDPAIEPEEDAELDDIATRSPRRSPTSL